MKKILSYFLRGLLITVPVVLTFYLLYAIITTIDGFLGFEQPGLGLLISIAGVTLAGFLGTSFIAKPLINWFNNALKRVPLVKTVYDAIKDLLSAFVGGKKSFKKVVMVQVRAEEDIWRLGFITEENLSEYAISEDYVAVYFPHSYNFSGNLCVVPKKNIKEIDAKPADVMKFIVSAGVSKTQSTTENQSI